MKIYLSLLFFFFAGLLWADELRVLTTPEEGCFTICSSVSADKCVIVSDANEAEVVSTVVTCLKSDLKAVTRKTFYSYNTVQEGKNMILVGTIGQSTYIDQLIADGKIDVSDVRGKWEAFGLQVVDNPMEGVSKALVIFGSQPRATAYGMFELSRMTGVSPWIWWADVAPTIKTQLYVTQGRKVLAPPR